MSELKYKVGDSVLIKSIDWYNEYKNEDGDVSCGEFNFVEGMKKFCSETLTISEDVGDGYLMFEDYHGYVWNDDMFEALVERNGKTYPYKIGDRVVLKGNNRCATITDLKCNSLGDLLYYIRIDNDRHSINYPTELLLPYKEPKFKVGDRVIVRDMSGIWEITNLEDDILYTIKRENHTFTLTTYGSFLTLYEGISDKKEEMKSEDELLDEYEELTDRAFKGGYEKCKSDIELNGFQLPEGYQFVDENGNIINATKIVLEKKKKEYPNSYSKCCDILECPFLYLMNTHRHANELQSLYMLLVCRDAYWKIAGEEMGLGKPWEPDWTNYNDYKFVIGVFENEIIKCYNTLAQYVLAFPTEEMRDAFYENFKKEIEICKELL